MIDRETGLWIYNKMNEIRDFEETAWTLFTENKLRGSVHLYTGEEAVAASVCAQLTDEDYIASTHRGHGHCIAKGAELDRALAELMGKATGYCKGRSGSMHIADFSKGNLGANAIVGGGIPIATGGGLAIKMQNRKNVSVAFFGDGASNQGTFHESINLAAVWKLPVIYVCENNQFGMTVPTWQSTSVENIADRAAGYGIPGEVVDGNDVCAVYEAFARAKERALKGEGPTLLECKTYRWRGHWTGDPEPYRTREEVEEWKEKRDPIKLFRAYLIRHKLATRQELDDIEAAAAKKMEAARPQFQHEGKPDVDLVLTTQEIINMIKESGIQLPQLDLEAPDLPFGLGSGAAVGSNGTNSTTYGTITTGSRLTVTAADGLAGANASPPAKADLTMGGDGGNGGGGGSPAGLCGISYEPDSGVSTSIEPGTPGPGGQGSPGGQGGDGIIILYFNVPVVKPSGPLVTKTPKWFNDKFGRRFIV